MAIRMKTGFIAAAAVAANFAAAPAPAQLFLSTPDVRSAAIEPSDPLVGLPMPGATAAEYRANLLWNMRAGLNVAALQCQFSDYLRAVPNYNGLLAHHSAELATAYTTLNNYYKRTLGAKGQKAFDDYSTMTYNGWSAAQAQQIFCQTASNVTKSALAAPKGQLYPVAQARLREMRNALVPAYEPRPVYRPYLIRFIEVPPLSAACYNKKGLLRRACGGSAK
ncbi:MAG TPA: hypothetical protein VE891_03925 [Allosphingosinicella sp.]|nr:hypothetical protein [Allosphingosinicella sp.]